MNMNNRMKLAIACYCRVFLRLNGFVTECENERIHKKIRAWQIKNNIEISDEQLDSVEVTYNDKAKED